MNTERSKGGFWKRNDLSHEQSPRLFVDNGGVIGSRQPKTSPAIAGSISGCPFAGQFSSCGSRRKRL